MANLELPAVNNADYVQHINSFDLLGYEEEIRLFEARNRGCSKARSTLVHRHLRMVVPIARSLEWHGVPCADLIQEGNIGLIQAVEKFDLGRGVRLCNYAVPWIKMGMYEYIIRNKDTVKFATTKPLRKMYFNLKRHLSADRGLSDREMESIAERYGVTIEDVRVSELRYSNQDVSYEEIDKSVSEGAFTNGCAVTSDNAIIVDFKTKQLEWVASVLKTFPKREQEIIRARHFGEKKKTLRALAKKYSVTAECIRQAEKQTIRRLREKSEMMGVCA